MLISYLEVVNITVFEKDITRENSYELRDISKGDIIIWTKLFIRQNKNNF